MSTKNSEGFYWIKSGSEKADDSIQSIQQQVPTGKTSQRSKTKRPGDRNAARAGLKDGWIRATFIVREENVNKLKALAYWDRRGIKDIVDEALTEYLKEKNIKPLNEKR
jgi:hypothetical protein